MENLGPQHSYSVKPKQTLSMQTRDGVRLDADVYYPDAEGEFPVLLMRQPYGRAIASTVVYAHPSWYAAHGYIVVIQDVRGRGTSEGDFSLFAHEIADGEDAVRWAASLPRSTGKVGMYGFSYQGMTQLYAAMSRPDQLKALAPGMVGYDLHADWAYEGGAFCLQASLGWAIQLAAETARLRGDATAYQALFQASRSLPLTDAVPARPQILDHAPDSFYHDWLNHPDPADSYWQQLRPNLDGVDLPMLHIGGWFDAYLRGTVHLYKDMAARSQQRQQLLIGPWNHIPWGRKVGAVDFGPEANNPVDALQIRWFDQWLKGQDTGLLAEAPICLFEMGSNRWRTFDQWPQGPTQTWTLASTGLAGMRDRDGILQADSPESLTCQDVIVHDPWRPVPALGGHAAFPAGMFDRSSIDCRSDVLTYTTDSLPTPLHIAGDLTVTVHCSADAPSFDLCAILSNVHTDGRVYHLSQGYRHCAAQSSLDSSVAAASPAANALKEVQIQLQPICAQIPKGHALRLSLSAACFPAYPVNPGTGAFPGHARQMDAQIITVTIRSCDRAPSQVQLSLAPPG